MIGTRSTDAVSYEVTLEEGGIIRLPAEVQERLGVPTGDIIQVIVTGSGLYLKTALIIPDATERLTQLMEAQGVTLDELMAGLDEAGNALFEERYGNLLKQD